MAELSPLGTSTNTDKAKPKAKSAQTQAKLDPTLLGSPTNPQRPELASEGPEQEQNVALQPMMDVLAGVLARSTGDPMILAMVKDKIDKREAALAAQRSADARYKNQLAMAEYQAGLAEAAAVRDDLRDSVIEGAAADRERVNDQADQLAEEKRAEIQRQQERAEGIVDREARAEAQAEIDRRTSQIARDDAFDKAVQKMEREQENAITESDRVALRDFSYDKMIIRFKNTEAHTTSKLLYDYKQTRGKTKRDLGKAVAGGVTPIRTDPMTKDQAIRSAEKMKDDLAGSTRDAIAAGVTPEERKAMQEEAQNFDVQVEGQRLWEAAQVAHQIDDVPYWVQNNVITAPESDVDVWLGQAIAAINIAGYINDVADLMIDKPGEVGVSGITRLEESIRLGFTIDNGDKKEFDDEKFQIFLQGLYSSYIDTLIDNGDFPNNDEGRAAAFDFVAGALEPAVDMKKNLVGQ